MMRTMGGSSGALYGVFFRAASTVSTSEVFDLSWLRAFLQNGLHALQQRTEAQVGDKTLLDALVPGALSLVESHPSDSISLALSIVVEAAHDGAKSTVGMIPRFGRGRTVGDRAAQAQDPGATSMWLILDGFRQGVQTL